MSNIKLVVSDDITAQDTILLCSPLRIKEFVAVVRCKDCQHHEIVKDGTLQYRRCELTHEAVPCTWYCAAGELKKVDEGKLLI